MMTGEKPSTSTFLRHQLSLITTTMTTRKQKKDHLHTGPCRLCDRGGVFCVDTGDLGFLWYCEEHEPGLYDLDAVRR
jgi:hypothetical protein